MTIGLNEKERATLAQYGICDICIENAQIQPLYEEDGTRRDLLRSKRGDVLPPDLRQALERHPKFFMGRMVTDVNASVRIFEEMCRMMDLIAACVLAYDKFVATGKPDDLYMAKKVQRIGMGICSKFSNVGPDRTYEKTAARELNRQARYVSNPVLGNDLDACLAPILAELDEARHSELFNQEAK